MSIAGDNQIETAVARRDVPSGQTLTNVSVLEASEDRLIHEVKVTTSETDCLAEVSFSNNFALDDADAEDPTASGVLGIDPGAAEATVQDYEGKVQWDAGEEISLHVDNAGPNSALNTVLITYEPVGDFSRTRLRNR